MTPTDEVNQRFPRGTKVRGIVCSHTHYGYFVEIPGIEILGLVETILMNESEKKSIPEIGSEIEAVILQFRDPKVMSPQDSLKRQFRLSVHPDILAKSELIKLLEE